MEEDDKKIEVVLPLYKGQSVFGSGDLHISREKFMCYHVSNFSFCFLQKTYLFGTGVSQMPDIELKWKENHYVRELCATIYDDRRNYEYGN